MWVLWAAAALAVDPDVPVDEAPAAAEEAPPEVTEDDDGVETIVVYGDLIVERARGELDARLRGIGYRPGISKGDRVVYRPEAPWKPTVVVFDDGLVALKRSPVRFGMGDDVNPWFHVLCPIMPTSCVKVGGQVLSPKKLDAAKERVLEATEDEAEALTEALVQRETAARLEELDATLDALWLRGVDLYSDAILDGWDDRRAALLEYWSTRTCTDSGDAFADAIGAYIRHEVQGSEHAATTDELAAAEAASACGRTLAP